MYSRIIQAEEKIISREDYIEESMFYDGFVGSIADYVDGDTDRESDLEWAFGDKEIFELDEKKEVVKIINREKYFEKNFKTWKKVVERLQNKSFEDFCAGFDMFELTSAYEDEFEFYISDEFGNCQTMDSWMRGVKNGEVFFLGGTIAYHY